jgi:hypothetical protein
VSALTYFTFWLIRTLWLLLIPSRKK